MEQPEEFFEESSEEEVQVVLPAVQVDPLNVEVAEIPDNPESPSPEPSPVSPQPSPLVGGPPVPPPPSSPEGGLVLNYELLHIRRSVGAGAVDGGREGRPKGPGGSYRGARGVIQFENLFDVRIRETMGN